MCVIAAITKVKIVHNLSVLFMFQTSWIAFREGMVFFRNIGTQCSLGCHVFGYSDFGFYRRGVSIGSRDDSPLRAACDHREPYELPLSVSFKLMKHEKKRLKTLVSFTEDIEGIHLQKCVIS